ncbi:BRO family protein [Butyrivibrio sp.]|uniref:BRO family protein n=1 Tax=Butyrivibrio sp. TaxID=28121 RepID=UPI0025BCB2BC|nr:BRO family protein [Butyrivibrio sp.]
MIEKLGNEYGQEFWYAKELQYALEYASWAKFKRVLNKAKTACNNSEASIDDHFAQVGKMVEAGIAPKSIEDYELSRYACYLIVMNGDSKKAIIALGQTYFAYVLFMGQLINIIELEALRSFGIEWLYETCCVKSMMSGIKLRSLFEEL